MFAFTLAEVLITLVIIGVIAAMTVPSLINKTQNQEYVSKLKKTYSTLSQATNQIIAEEGPATNWVTSRNNVYNLYKKKLLNAKECSQTTGCFEQGMIKSLNSTDDANWDTINGGKLVLSDGTQITIGTASISQTCSDSNKVNDGSTGICARFLIDINGAKKPNTWGKDVFEFVIKKNGLYPAGCDIDGLCNKSYSGRACACRVLREGAMNY